MAKKKTTKNSLGVDKGLVAMFLKSIGAFHRRLDDKVIEPTERDISEEGHALFSTQLDPLDVLAVIEEGETYEDLLEHTVDVKFRGHTIKGSRVRPTG